MLQTELETSYIEGCRLTQRRIQDLNSLVTLQSPDTTSSCFRLRVPGDPLLNARGQTGAGIVMNAHC